MNKHPLVLLLVISLVLSGCSTPSSPLPVSGSGLNATDGVAGVGGTALGALVGQQVNKKYGAVVGAPLVGAASVATAEAIQQGQKRQVAEAKAEGERLATLRILKQVIARNQGEDGVGLNPGGTVEGVNVMPSITPSNGEPIR